MTSSWPEVPYANFPEMRSASHMPAPPSLELPWHVSHLRADGRQEAEAQSCSQRRPLTLCGPRVPRPHMGSCDGCSNMPALSGLAAPGQRRGRPVGDPGLRPLHPGEESAGHGLAQHGPQVRGGRGGRTGTSRAWLGQTFPITVLRTWAAHAASRRSLHGDPIIGPATDPSVTPPSVRFGLGVDGEQAGPRNPGRLC